MALLKNLRIYIVILLIVWAIIAIHPFSPKGVIIERVYNPASRVLRAGDWISEVNNEKIKTLDDFEDVISNIQANDTVEVTIKRETFPYKYKELDYVYIAGEKKDKKVDIAMYVKQSEFSKIKFSNEIAGGNKFTIKTNNINAAKKILSNRFAITQIRDFSFFEENGDLIVTTTYGNEVKDVIENKGVLEAKIGENLFFTNKDIEKYCISGTDCSISLHPKIVKTENETKYMWKFGFEATLDKDASQRFAELTNLLSVSSCEYDVCILNDTIKYFVDGKYVGKEEIYADNKGKNLSKVIIGGTAETRQDAITMLHFVQASLVGELDAKVEKIEQVETKLGNNFVTICLVVAIIIAAVGAGTTAIQLKKRDVFVRSFLTSLAEVTITLGVISALNFIVKPLTMYTIIFLPVITTIYQNYLSAKIKKESFVMKKLDETNNKVVKVLIIMLVAAMIFTVIIPEISSTIIIYLSTVLILTKGIFINGIKEMK